MKSWGGEVIWDGESKLQGGMVVYAKNRIHYRPNILITSYKPAQPFNTSKTHPNIEGWDNIELSSDYIKIWLKMIWRIHLIYGYIKIWLEHNARSLIAVRALLWSLILFWKEYIIVFSYPSCYFIFTLVALQYVNHPHPTSLHPTTPLLYVCLNWWRQSFSKLLQNLHFTC